MRGGLIADKRRVALLFAALVVVLALVAAGCGGDDDSAAPPPAEPASPAEEPAAEAEEVAVEWDLATAAAPYAGSTVTFLYEGNGDTSSSPGIAASIPIFEEITGINVDIQELGHGDVIQKGEADLHSGQGEFDIVLLHPWQAPGLLEAGVIAPLNSYMEDPALADPAFSFDNMAQPETNDVAHLGDGSIITLSTLYDYFNVNWIRRDLIEHPDEQAAFEVTYGYALGVPQTIEQMRDIAEFFSRDAGETLAGETLDASFAGIAVEGVRAGTMHIEMIAWLGSFCGGLYDENGNPTANSPENVAALEFWAELWDYAPANTAEISVLDAIVIPTQGNTLMGYSYTDWLLPLDTPEVTPDLAGSFGYFAFPGPADNPECRTQPGAPAFNVVNSKSENKEASFLLLQWLTTPEFSLAWGENSPTVIFPVHQDTVAEVRANYTDPYPWWAEGYDANVEGQPFIATGTATTTWRGTKILEILDNLAENAQAVGLNQQSAQEALDEVQAFMTDICESNCYVESIGR